MNGAAAQRSATVLGRWPFLQTTWVSININRYLMEESKVSKQLATETICLFPAQHPLCSKCSSKSEFGYPSSENLSGMSDVCG